jgi:two-component system, cell cycle response regulator DivK
MSKDINHRIILIAEDEMLNYLLLKHLLEKNKINHLWAKNGLEAFEFCRDREDIVMVIMDIKMPFMDGLEATRRIKKIKPSIKIIAHTAFAMDYDNIEAMEAGCDDYISKPAKHDHLISTIKKHLPD